MTFGISTIATSSISASTITSDGIELDNLGPELQNNWDMSKGLSEWTSTATATTEAVIDDGRNSVLITQISGTSASGRMNSAGLEIGKFYLVRTVARIGVQGTEQRIGSYEWGVNDNNDVTQSTYEVFELAIEATADSGFSFLTLSDGGGAAGDELYISELSIREIL